MNLRISTLLIALAGCGQLACQDPPKPAAAATASPTPAQGDAATATPEATVPGGKAAPVARTVQAAPSPSSSLSATEPEEVAREFLTSTVSGDTERAIALMEPAAAAAYRKAIADGMLKPITFQSPKLTGAFTLPPARIGRESAEVEIPGEDKPTTGRLRRTFLILSETDGRWGIAGVNYEFEETEPDPEETGTVIPLISMPGVRFATFADPGMKEIFGETDPLTTLTLKKPATLEEFHEYQSALVMQVIGKAFKSMAKAFKAENRKPEPIDAEGEQRAYDALRPVTPQEYGRAWQAGAAAKDEPLGALLKRLGDQAGMRLPSIGDLADPSKRVSFDFGERSAVEGLEMVCASVGLYPDYSRWKRLTGTTNTSDTRGQVFWFRSYARLPRPVLLTHAGPYVLGAYFQSLHPRYGTGLLRIKAVAGVPLPGVVLANRMQFQQRMIVTSALTSSGMEVVKPGTALTSSGQVVKPGTDSPSRFDYSDNLDKKDTADVIFCDAALRLKGLTRADKAFTHIRGTVEVKVPLEVVEVVFDKLEEGASKMVGAYKLILKKVDRGPWGNRVEPQPGSWSVTARRRTALAIELPPRQPGEEPGVKIQLSETYSEPAQTFDRADPSEPLRFKFVPHVETYSYPFEILDVPIPGADRLPESYPALDFSGHPAPAEVHFKAFAEKDDSGDRRAQLTVSNQSNLDIKSMWVSYQCLDASGAAVKLVSGSVQSTDASKPLAAAGQTAEATDSPSSMPEATQTLRPKVTGVTFMDDTEWKAPEPEK